MVVKRAGFELVEWTPKEFNWYHGLFSSPLHMFRRTSPVWEALTWDASKRKTMFTNSPRFVVRVSVERRP